MNTLNGGVMTAAFAVVMSFGIAGTTNSAPIPIDLLASNTLLGIYLKDFPSGLNEHHIDLNGDSGTTVTGNVQGVSGTPLVNFTSPSSLDSASGFANIKPGGDTYNLLTITLPATSTYTGAFGDFLFDVQLLNPKQNNPVDLTISAFNGITLLGTLTLTNLTTPDVQHDSDTSFLVLGENSTVITSIVLASISGFKETKHFQISDLQLVVCTEDCGDGGPRIDPTPLPGALPLFASGGALLGFLGWRRKRKRVA